MILSTTLITNDAVVFGILISILALVFYTASLKKFETFYRFIPTILLCFFVPGLLSSFNIISANDSNIDEIASKYLLPVCLVFFVLSIDLKAIKQLGSKALFVFLAGSLGIMVGGPLAVFVVKGISPNSFLATGDDEIWRGLSTIAGSWIGGNANQMALKEVFHPSSTLFAQTSVIDVLMSELWLALLLYGVSISAKLDKKMKADTSVIEELKHKMETEHHARQRNPSIKDLVILFAVGFGITGIGHLLADNIVPFIEQNYPNLKAYSLASKSFWVITFATTSGLILAQTKGRNLENIGASKFGTLFLYILITTIGMQMNIFDALKNPILLLIGFIWILTHAVFTLIAARIVRAPFFFTAIGSQANVGGVASTSVVASAFHPSLAPVGVLLAILGNAIGTYLGYLTGLLMQWVSK
jgi:uncharacterized membrane protein